MCPNQNTGPDRPILGHMRFGMQPRLLQSPVGQRATILSGALSRRESPVLLKMAAATIVGLLLLPTGAIAQQRAELIVGWLGYSGGMINQVLSLRNNGLLPIKSAKIGCSFFSSSTKLGAGSVNIEKIDPNSVEYKTISLVSGQSPDRAACRLVSVKWERQSSESYRNFRAAGRATSFDQHHWQLTWQPVDRYR